MKAISISKSSLRSSSFLNTCTYLARSSRIATAAKKDHMVQLDRVVKFRLATDWIGRPRFWVDSETDQLQRCLAYSNSELYTPEDLLYLSHNYEVMAASLEEEEAGRLKEEAEFFKYEAKTVFQEDLFISRWEEIYDMM